MLFDFGGTLALCPAWMDLELDTLVSAVLEGLRSRAWPVPSEVDHDRGQEILHHLRHVASETWMECPARRCVEEILPRLGMSCPPADLLDDVLEELYEGILVHLNWLPGSRELLTGLAAEGIALGLVSNAAYAPFIYRALAEARVAELFRTVVISAETGWRKPHPSTFLRALGELGVEPREAFHVGDHIHQDVVGASRVGLRVIWVNPGPTPVPGGGVTPVVVPDLGEAARYLLTVARGSRRAGPPPR